MFSPLLGNLQVVSILSLSLRVIWCVWGEGYGFLGLEVFWFFFFSGLLVVPPAPTMIYVAKTAEGAKISKLELLLSSNASRAQNI